MFVCLFVLNYDLFVRGTFMRRCDDCSLTRNLGTCAFVEVRNWGASRLQMVEGTCSLRYPPNTSLVGR
jgi:hypothetical protein